MAPELTVAEASVLSVSDDLRVANLSLAVWPVLGMKAFDAVCSVDSALFSEPSAEMRDWYEASFFCKASKGCCSTCIKLVNMPFRSRPEPIPKEERVAIMPPRWSW